MAAARRIMMVLKKYFLDVMMGLYINNVSHFVLETREDFHVIIPFVIIPLPKNMNVSEGDIIGDKMVYSVSKTIGRLLEP